MRKPSSTPLVLVTGGAGKTGLAVIKRLLETTDSRLRVRGLARNTRQAMTLEEAGAHEIAVGDMRDPAAMAPALAGADSVYHICPNVHPGETEIGRQLISLARTAGVRFFVYHSVLQPAIQAMPHHWAKNSVETALAESGLAFTVLQPAPYMQNLLGQGTSIAEQSFFSVPYGLATRVSMVDLEDVAEASARVLTNHGHAGMTYELCAPGLLDQTEIAAALSHVLGREVLARATDQATWAAAARADGMTDYQVDTLLAMFRYYERFGMTGTAEPLEGLLGRRPTTFEQFAERTFQP